MKKFKKWKIKAIMMSILKKADQNLNKESFHKFHIQQMIC